MATWMTIFLYKQVVELFYVFLVHDVFREGV